jgi:hypothetical protein
VFGYIADKNTSNSLDYSREAIMSLLERGERLQVMLNEEELAAVENWRCPAVPPRSGNCYGEDFRLMVF